MCVFICFFFDEIIYTQKSIANDFQQHTHKNAEILNVLKSMYGSLS